MQPNLSTLKEELLSELETNILPYWINNTVDKKHGGFVGKIDHFNAIIPNASKGAVLNARILWTFSAAFRILHDKSYFEPAKRAYQYIQDHFIDKQFGGVFWELDHQGKPLNTRKQIYALSFTIYGLSEYYRISGEEKALRTAIELFELIEKHSLDKTRNGYIEALSRDWQPLDDLRLSEKDANESKTMNTHLHILEAYANLFRVWKNERLRKSLTNLIRLFIDRFIDPKSFHQNLFFDDDWNLKSEDISFGHDIECSWLLYEACEILNDEKLRTEVLPLTVNMANSAFRGIDNDGGMMNEEFPSKKKFDTDKHWWPQAEALVGFFNAYQLSGDKKFLEQTLSSWNFIKSKIIDKENGEWYWRVNQQGVPNTRDEKAGFWKCPYHNSRACMELIERINA